MQPLIPMTIVPTVILALLLKAPRLPIGLRHLKNTKPRSQWGHLRGHPLGCAGHPSHLSFNTFWPQDRVRMIWLKPLRGMSTLEKWNIFESEAVLAKRENLFFWTFHAFFCQFTLLFLPTPFTFVTPIITVNYSQCLKIVKKVFLVILRAKRATLKRSIKLALNKACAQ